MKVKFLMVLLVICLVQILTVSGQSNPEGVFVKNIGLIIDPNPRFVWSFTENIISRSKEADKNEISCLKRELMNTGLFESVEHRFDKRNDSNKYNLILTIKFYSSDPVYRVSKIEMSGIKEANKSKFKELLKSESLIGKSISLRMDYTDFEDKIFELVKKSVADETKREEINSLWFDLRLNNQELEVTVRLRFRGCSTAL